MTIPAWKMEKYRQAERWLEENKACEKGQTVFTGSSLMEGFPVERWAAELGPDAPKVYNRGLGGFTTQDMLPLLPAMVTGLQPRTVFINIGTNDLSDPAVTIGMLMERYDEILTRIETEVPGVALVLMAYYPINFDAADEGMKANLRIRTNERIREANRAVEALARRHGARYMDFNAPLTDEQGRLKAEYTIEGMHIREEGYRAIWPQVAKAIMTPAICFEDYHAVPDDAITEITPEGIRTETGAFIRFTDCAANFSALHSGSGRCVGERDATGSNPSIDLYTAPLTTHIIFVSRGPLGHGAAMRRFHALQRQIEAFGYTTYDAT